MSDGTSSVSWPAVAGAVLAGLALALWLARRALRSWGRRTVLEFRARVDRYKLTATKRVKAELVADSVIQTAITRHAEIQRVPREQVERLVGRYIEEIVPFSTCSPTTNSATTSPSF